MKPIYSIPINLYFLNSYNDIDKNDATVNHTVKTMNLDVINIEILHGKKEIQDNWNLIIKLRSKNNRNP